MTDRTDLPLIKPKNEPSYWNVNAVRWGFWTALASSVPAALIKGRAALAISGIVPTVATIYGAVTGKAQQEADRENGKHVNSPTYWNWGIFAPGVIVGLALRPLIAYRAFKGQPIVLSAPVSIAAGIASLGSIIAGSIIRKGYMQEEFDQAAAARNEEIAELKRSSLRNTPEPQQTNGASPYAAAKSFADRVLESQNHNLDLIR